jgi:uncharacterized protein YdhG (YjbR/CyaY superfamily)
MAKTDFKTADEYLAALSPETRKVLETVRKTIRAAVPGAEEVISYQIPAFRKDGRWVFYYSGYKGHYALACPPPFAAFKAFAKELAPYKKSVSTVQFPYDQPVPVALITQMSKHQFEQNAAVPAPTRRPVKAPAAKPAAKKTAKKAAVKSVAQKTVKKAVKKVAKKAARKK